MGRSWNRRKAKEEFRRIVKGHARHRSKTLRIDRLEGEERSPAEIWFQEALIKECLESPTQKIDNLYFVHEMSQNYNSFLKRVIRVGRKMRMYPIPQEMVDAIAVKKRLGHKTGNFQEPYDMIQWALPSSDQIVVSHGVVRKN